MKSRSTRKPSKQITAEEFDRRFERGEDVSEYVDWNLATAVYPVGTRRMACACQRQVSENATNATFEFKKLWKSCPALNKILIPDLSEWQKACRDMGIDGSGDRSILLGAFERGCLHRLTLPIHLFLMSGDNPRSDLTKQYAKDLRERWICDSDPSKRHRKSKQYLGRLTELLAAQWLQSECGLCVIGLEATGGKHDICVRSSDGAETAIEVKFIGTEDKDFELLQKMPDGAGALDGETAGDLLLTRVYEAGKQLSDYSGRKAAYIIIDDFFSSALRAALKFRFIDLRNPELRSKDEKWLEHLDKLRNEYPAIEKEFREVISSLADIRFFLLKGDETFDEVRVRRP